MPDQVGFKRSPESLGLIALFVVFLAGRLVMLRGGKILTAPDSWVYAHRDDPARNLGPLVSFTGHAPRPWGLPIFYALFGNDSARVAGQWTLATLAWAFLAWELTRQMRTTLARLVTCAAVLGLALMNTVASWDFAILSESISISLGLIVIALFLRWRRTGSVGYLIALTAFAVWWTFIRPDIRVFTVVLILLLAWYALRGKQNRVAPAVACLALLLGVGWYAAITPAMNEAFKAYDGDAIPGNPMPLDEEIFVHRLRTLTFTDPALLETFHTKLNMPSCPATEKFAQRSDWATIEFGQAYRSCPDMVAWGDGLGHDFWGGLAKADPVAAAGKFFETVSYTLGGQIYASAPQVVPGLAERAVFPSRRFGLPITLAALAAGLAIALATGGWRRHRRMLLTGLVLGTTSILSAIAAVARGSGEYGRFGIQETIASRLAVIIFVCLAIDLLVERRRRTLEGESAREQPRQDALAA
jgi:hypothetical protein